MKKTIKELRKLLEDYQILRSRESTEHQGAVALIVSVGKVIGETANWRAGLTVDGTPFIEWTNNGPLQTIQLEEGDTLTILLPSHPLPHHAEMIERVPELLDEQDYPRTDPDLFQRYKSALGCIASAEFETRERCIEFAQNALDPDRKIFKLGERSQ